MLPGPEAISLNVVPRKNGATVSKSLLGIEAQLPVLPAGPPRPCHRVGSTAELGWVHWSSGIILMYLLYPFVFPKYPCLYLEPFSD